VIVSQDARLAQQLDGLTARLATIELVCFSQMNLSG
jgi:hypothetical protein